MITKEIYKLIDTKLTDALKNRAGDPISVEVLPERADVSRFLAKRDTNYIFPVDAAVDLAISLDSRINTPVLIWGLHGSGKSTLAEQISLLCGRPSMRVQHSVDTEGSDIVGGWVLEGDRTVFHYGPLARAMKYGLVYIADEYDFGLPNVLAIYQAVLEGGSLFIKQAPEDMALITPHPDFRFIATGNTNGSGDETGLYQGTQIQNAANYSRFGMTIKLDYQKPEDEKNIIRKKIGGLPDGDLKQLMEFVQLVRKAYDDKTITNTISTREVLAIAKWAAIRGREAPAWSYGVECAFRNRMSSIDSAAIKSIADRVFGT